MPSTNHAFFSKNQALVSVSNLSFLLFIYGCLGFWNLHATESIMRMRHMLHKIFSARVVLNGADNKLYSNFSTNVKSKSLVWWRKEKASCVKNQGRHITCTVHRRETEYLLAKAMKFILVIEKLHIFICDSLKQRKPDDCFQHIAHRNKSSPWMGRYCV